MLSRVRTRISPAACVTILLITAVSGLLYVKWLPYAHRAATAYTTHSIGHSILTAGGAQAPPASLRSAIDYAVAYGKAIWQAMVLGLLLGSALQELAPPTLIPGLLGRPGWRGTALGLLFGFLMIIAVTSVVGRLGQDEELPREAVAPPAHAGDFHPTITGWLARFLRLALGLIPEYLIIVLVLGAARVWLFPQIGPAVNNSIVWVVAMAAAGLIFVIPTAGEVPIVQGMRALGVGAGPAAALLLTLPPVSLPSIAMTKSVFSSRVLALVAGTILVVGIAAGFAAVAFGFHG